MRQTKIIFCLCSVTSVPEGQVAWKGALGDTNMSSSDVLWEGTEYLPFINFLLPLASYVNVSEVRLLRRKFMKIFIKIKDFTNITRSFSKYFGRKRILPVNVSPKYLTDLKLIMINTANKTLIYVSIFFKALNFPNETCLTKFNSFKNKIFNKWFYKYLNRSNLIKVLFCSKSWCR